MIEKHISGKAPRARTGTSARSTCQGKPRCKGRKIGLRPRKPSLVIEAPVVRRVLMALTHAHHIGLLPTRMITLALDRGGSVDHVDTIGRFLKLYKDAARRRGWPTAHIWTREHGSRTGQHVHILLHVPASSGDWLKRRMPSWLKKAGLTRRKGVSHVSPIAGRPTGQSGSSTVPGLYQANLETVVRYVLKHCTSEAAKTFGIKSRGPIEVRGKRVGVSANLNALAQSRCEQCVSTSISIRN